jgi:hypothetical protein
MKTGIVVSAGQTTVEHFIRNAPFVVSVDAHNNTMNVVRDTVLIGTPMRIELTVENPSYQGAVVQSACGRMILDRDQAAVYEFDQTNPHESYSVGQVKTLPFYFTPVSLGSYYYSAGVTTNVALTGAALTDGWGWKASLFTVVSSMTGVDDATAPHAYVVLQNYPNPFNPTTIIEYTLELATSVRLKVVDVLGREIPLVNEVQSTGVHRQTWTSPGSGTYFAILESGGQRHVIRMLAIK